MGVSESEFESIVSGAASGSYRLVDYSVGGFTVSATFESGSGKQTWDASLQFDSETGHCSIYGPYGDSSAVASLAHDVAAGIQASND